MADQEKGSPPRCGYGLLGLCCTSCLLGPCRRSPFDDPKAGKYCGQDSDWIVAHSIAQRISRESLQAMANFRDALERLSGSGSRVADARLEGMKRLLSPFSRERSALLEMLYPEQAFPFLHAREFPLASWSAALLDAAAVRSETHAVTDRMEQALRLSAMALAAEALLAELAGITPEETDLDLPESPSPLLLLVSDDDPLPDAGRDASLRQIEAICRETVWIGKVRHIGQLPALGREIYNRWGIPASLSGSLAVVPASSMIPGLGALALGFSLTTLPDYPIKGSPRVEHYLTHDLKQAFGNAYIPIHPEEELGDQIMRSLTP